MRTTFTAKVSGTNQQEIMDKALDLWRSYMQNPDVADLPWDTVIELIVKEEDEADSASEPRVYNAVVYISD